MDYNKYASGFEALLPMSVNKNVGKEDLLNLICKYLPESEYLFDPEDLTTEHLRTIYKEFIREGVFNNISDEIPYESDVLIDKIDEKKGIDHIRATIIVEKESQKGIIIGSGGNAIKRIGTDARHKIEKLSGKKCFLELFVAVKKGWSSDKKFLNEMGYEW